MAIQYTAPKARRARYLAGKEDYQNEAGEPDIMRISAAVQLTKEAVRYVLTGDLPKDEEPERTRRRPPKTTEVEVPE